MEYNKPSITKLIAWFNGKSCLGTPIYFSDSSNKHNFGVRGRRLVFVFVLAGINLVFGIRSLSMATFEPVQANGAVLTESSSIINGAIVAKTVLPEVKKEVASKEIGSSMRVVATAYTSDPLETDDTPFTTASGTYVRPGVAASNVLPFGTKFKMPKLFGERIFVVEDRMNSRYNGKNIVDIWFADKDEAYSFGKKSATIEII